jgi:hypothetical protein
MKFTPTENQKLLASGIHLAAFTKYFIPFGNILIPAILWAINKDNDFIDAQGRNAVNFQLSIFVYTLIIGLFSVLGILLFADNIFLFLQQLDSNNFNFSPTNFLNFTSFGVFIFIVLSVFTLLVFFEIYAVIKAAIFATRGETYTYPFCISFISSSTTNKPISKPILK